MQIPSLSIRELTASDPLRPDEVEMSADQRTRVLAIQAHNAAVDARRMADLARRDARRAERER